MGCQFKDNPQELVLRHKRRSPGVNAGAYLDSPVSDGWRGTEHSYSITLHLVMLNSIHVFSPSHSEVKGLLAALSLLSFYCLLFPSLPSACKHCFLLKLLTCTKAALGRDHHSSWKNSACRPAGLLPKSLLLTLHVRTDPRMSCPVKVYLIWRQL